MFQGAPGALRVEFVGVPGHSEGHFVGVLDASRMLFRRSAEAFSARAVFPRSVEACSGILIVLEAGSGVADMIPPGSTIRLEPSKQNLRGPLSTLLTG